MQIAKRLAHAPDKSFAQALIAEAELEGLYRFITNDAFLAESVAATHSAKTLERASEHDTVLTIHDTTYFEYTDYALRKGLGRMHRE